MNAHPSQYTPIIVSDRIMWLDESGYRPYFKRDDGVIQMASVMPLPGSQTAFINCPLKEAMYAGNRGCGKTETLLMDYMKEVGKGYGSAWRGIIFRLEYKDLETVFAKAVRMVKMCFPNAKINHAKGNQRITFAGGETLEFAILAREQDYNNYHGQEFAWIGWEELTQWATDVAYRGMFSVLRSGVVGLPVRVRSTTNPNGAGHNWVKRRFQLSGYSGKGVAEVVTITDANTGEELHEAVAILGDLSENFVLNRAQPDYLKQIKAAADGNQAKYQSWVYGSWDITSGGMFDDIWHDVKKHMVVPRFTVPHTWRVFRSFDWGSAAPFSVTWWARSDGCDVHLPDGRVMHTLPDDLFIIHEWMGCSASDPAKGLQLTAKEVAQGIVERELLWGIHRRVQAGPADNSINTADGGASIADMMAQPVHLNGKIYNGVNWTPSDKSAGSRKHGAQIIRNRMKASAPVDGMPRETAGLFIFDDCPAFSEYVVPLPRDPKDPEDVDTKANDHKYDDIRYGIATREEILVQRKTKGL